MAVLAIALLLARAQPARGQAEQAGGEPPAGPAVQFVTAYRFHLDAASLFRDDPHYRWIANFGGDLDVVRWGRVGVNLAANYEVILGDEFRPFDPYQGNYTVETAGVLRLERADLAAVFHHVSRHLSDRAKRLPVDWNMAGVQLAFPLKLGPVALDTRARLMTVVNRSYVDYAWRLEGQLRGARPLRGRLAAIVDAQAGVTGVDRDVHGRGTLVQGRLEGGLELRGVRGAIQFFLAVERRHDADPLDLVTREWGLFGIRFASR